MKKQNNKFDTKHYSFIPKMIALTILFIQIKSIREKYKEFDVKTPLLKESVESKNNLSFFDKTKKNSLNLTPRMNLDLTNFSIFDKDVSIHSNNQYEGIYRLSSGKLVTITPHI